MAWTDSRLKGDLPTADVEAFAASRWARLVAAVGGEEHLPPTISVVMEAHASASLGNPHVPSGRSEVLVAQSTVSHAQTPPAPPSPEPESRPAPTKGTGIEPPHSPSSQEQGAQRTSKVRDLQETSPAPIGLDYCPFGAVTKFCYKHVRKEFSQAVASRFFDRDKIFDRPWDLYYTYTDECIKPIILAPVAQVQELLDTINAALPRANAIITDELREEGFVVNFHDDPQHLRPYFLGHSASREQHDLWVRQLALRPTVRVNMAPGRTLEAYKEKIAAIQEVQKQKSKARKAAKWQQTLQIRGDMSRKLLECERMLGLISAKNSAQQTSVHLSPFDPEKPAAHPCELDAIIIAIDVEAHEFHASAITEVGVATLDTRDLKDVAPGIYGEHWHRFVSARHFRVAEYLHHKNTQFVQGCPENFEFGKSEIASLQHLPAAVGSCLRFPFCKTPAETNNGAALGIEQDRNIVLLGHDLRNDINYLTKVGIDVLGRRGIVGKLDTLDMYKAYNNHPDSRALGSILAEFDQMGWHLHNAGNDAVYTLWAMFAIAVKDAAGQDSRTARVERLSAAKTDEAVANAKAMCAEDVRGWDASIGAVQ